MIWTPNNTPGPKPIFEEFLILLSAWTKADALGAITWADKNYGGTVARNAILTTWAASDPNAAIQWAETAFARADKEGAEKGNYWMVGVIRGAWQNDPALATSLLVNMPYSKERAEALATILPQIALQGPDATREWITSLPDESLRAGAMERMKNSPARRGPADKAY